MRFKNEKGCLCYHILVDGILVDRGMLPGCEGGAGEEVLVNLNISVALSDVAQSMARGVEEDAGAKGEHEKMQRLRVIVVRENDVVEKNDFIGPLSPTMVSDRVSGKFEVVSREWKRIYLFVNEDNEQIKVGQGDSNDALTLARFLDNIKVGEVFPTEEVTNLVVRVDVPSGQLVGALPMSECPSSVCTQNG